MKCICQGHISLICELSDDESTVITLVLVAVFTLEVELLASNHHLLAAAFWLALVPQLRQPLEMRSMDLLVCKEFVNDVSVVLLHDDHRLNLLPVAIAEFVSALLYNLNEGFDLLLVKVP